MTLNNHHAPTLKIILREWSHLGSLPHPPVSEGEFNIELKKKSEFLFFLVELKSVFILKNGNSLPIKQLHISSTNYQYIFISANKDSYY